VKNGELGKALANGEYLFREGDQSEVMYVVQEGKIGITKSSDQGDITIATINAGEVFGEMSLFDKMARSASAVADGDARVLSIDRKKLFTTISKDPTLAFKIIETLSKRVRVLDEEIIAINKNKSAVVQSFFTVDQICDFVLTTLSDIVHADNTSIMLADTDGKTLSIKSAKGLQAENKMLFEKGGGIAGSVFETGRAVIMNRAEADMRFQPGELQIKAILCVPLAYRDEILGVVNLSSTSEDMFTSDDLLKVQSFASGAAIAIQNALCCSALMNATDSAVQHATMMNRG